MSRRLLVPLASLLAFGALAAPAGAATVSQVIVDSCRGDLACSKYGGGRPVPVTTIAATAGEANRVTVTRDGAGFLIADAGAPLLAQAPCTQVDPATVRCPLTEGLPGIPGLTIDVGDGDDQAAIVGDPGIEATFTGGPGADVLAGGDGNDTIDGGLGDDLLTGGGGFNTLTYAGREADVTVDLRGGFGGAAGEQDTVSGFIALIGGDGVDVLLGSDADETIDGGPGADTVHGRAGDDDLFGSTGPDALRGGKDDDRLFGDPEQGDDYYTPRIKLADDFLQGDAGDDLLADTGGRNTYLGGRGRDTIEGGSGRDRVNAGAGNDKVDTRGGARDTVDCGSGRDRARTDRRKDRRRRCERD